MARNDKYIFRRTAQNTKKVNIRKGSLNTIGGGRF